MRDIDRMAYRRHGQRGVSLLEVLAAIVVMGLVFAGFVSTYATVMKHGSDAQLHGQAVAIAASYLDEILARAYRDPDDGALCGTPEANRTAFDDVCDYDGLSQNGCTAVTGACPVIGACACDSTGAPLDGLAAFGVSVTINPMTLSGANGLQVRVDVANDGLAGNGVSLLAFRSED
jgi:MSHA pilin protein MshD